MAIKKAGKGPGPAPLEPKVVKKLLDLLSTDNEFRRLFKKDANAALIKAGYKPPAAISGRAMASAAAVVSLGSCLQMASTASIAPKAKIIRERAKLETTLNAIQHFVCPAELMAD
jgi:putative modified peptide